MSRKFDPFEGIGAIARHILEPRVQRADFQAMLRKVVRSRQAQVAHLMLWMNDFSLAFETLLVVASPRVDWVGEPFDTRGVSATDLRMLRATMADLERRLRSKVGLFRGDVEHFVTSMAYVDHLLINPTIVDYLKQFHPRALADLVALSRRMNRPVPLGITKGRGHIRRPVPPMAGRVVPPPSPRPVRRKGAR